MRDSRRPITRRVTLIVVVFAAVELALLGLTLRGQELLAAIGSFGGALRELSAARQAAVHSLRGYGWTGRPAELETFEEALARMRRLSPVRWQLEQPVPSFEAIERALLEYGSHPEDVAGMVQAARWVRFLPDYEAGMVSWATFDHQVGRLADTASELRFRREANHAVRVEDLLERIDRHDVMLRQVGGDFSASISSSARWLRRRLQAVEVAATAILLSGGVMLAALLLSRVRRAERARIESDQRYEALVSQDAVGIWQHNREGQLLFANPALMRMFGVDRLPSMRPWERFFTAENLETFRSEQAKQIDGMASTYEVEIQPAGSDGKRRLLVSGSPVRGEEGGLVESTIGTCIDISQRARAESALAESESRLRLIMGQMPAFLWTTDRALRYTFALGRTADRGAPTVVGRTVDQVLGSGPAGAAGASAHWRALEGESVTFEHTVSDRVYQSHVEPLRDREGRITGTIGVSLDITERKNFEARLSYLATRDPLTDLFNRRRFEEELDREVARTARSGHSALLWCDLDRFKEINDTLGHHAGDELLIHVANALRGELGSGEILGRLGGDEFGVLVPGASRREAELVAKRMLEVVSRDPLEVGDKSVHATASIGVVVLPTDSASAEEVLSHADRAMYQAKREGRNRYAVFSLDSGVCAVLGSQLLTAELLRSSLRDDRLVLHMQPIVALATGEIARWEALVRMPAEDGTLLQPVSFLGVAERFGLSRDLDRWVVGRSVELIRDFERRGERMVVAVNLSAVWLADDELAAVTEALVTKTGIDPASLVFEIKERAAVRDPEGAKRLIDRLVTLGSQVAVDDYGLGFSSFDLFRRLQVRYLKIDGSFIRGLGEDSVNRALVRAMIEMAHTLGMAVVAEFVDSEETLAWLTQHSCDFGEGWFLGRGRPIQELVPAAL